MSADLVSVVMPVYNAERWLSRAIESVLKQTHRNLQLITVDDGSGDDSAAILAQHAAKDERVHVLAQANAGVAATRNAAIAAATGDYIAFLDADDWWHEDKLTRQLAALHACDALICYTPYLRVDERDKVLGRVLPPLEVNGNDMLSSNFIGNLTGIYARQLGDIRFHAIGHEDYAFWLTQVRRAGRAIRVRSEEPLAYYLVRAQSLSANKLRAAAWQWTVLRQVAGLSPWQAAPCTARYAWHALRKRS